MRITIYQNSPLASCFSVVGTLVFYGSLLGLVCCVLALPSVQSVFGFIFSLVVLVALGAMGVGFIFLAEYINQEKTVDLTLRQIQIEGLEPQIAANTRLALTLYEQVPSKRMKFYLSRLNPQAGAIIMSIEHQNKQK